MRADVVCKLGFVCAISVHHPERIMVMRVRDIDDPFAIRTKGGVVMGTCIPISQPPDVSSASVDTENVVDVVYHSGESNLLSIGCPRWMSIIHIVMRQLLHIRAVDMNDVDF